MCFSKNMSLSFFIMGFAISLYLKYKKEKFNLYAPLFYFSIMELLQYLGYLSIEMKNNTFNKIIAIIIHIHIGFQPYFINKWFSNYIPKKNLIYIPFIEKISLVFGLFWFLRLFFVSDNILCNTSFEPNCGKKTEITKGLKHIIHVARSRAPNYLTPSIFMHFFLVFIPILFLTVNKFVYAITLLFGIIGWFMASNIHEAASIWCLSSIPFLIFSLIYR